MSNRYEEFASIRRVMALISEDMERDVKAYEGKPFTGKTIGEIHGNLAAAIDALAKAVDSLVEILEED